MITSQNVDNDFTQQNNRQLGEGAIEFVDESGTLR